MALPFTATLPIGSHISVPVRRADGSVYGMFCCLSPKPAPSLTSRDLEVMELFASLCSEHLNSAIAKRTRLDRIRRATEEAIAADGFTVVYQPILDLTTLHPLGFEALCRFGSGPQGSPERWFTESAEVGLATALECTVAERALTAL